MATHRFNRSTDRDARGSLDAVLADAVTRLEAGHAVDLQRIKTDFPGSAAEIDAFMNFGTDLMALMGSRLGPPPQAAETDARHSAARGTDPNSEAFATEALGHGTEAPPLGEDAIPTNIGRFEVLEELGEGSFGRVFVAYDDLINRKVAIKQVKQGVLNSADARRAYLHEARAVAQLEHPAIVKIKDVHDTADEPLALILQYVEGPTLSQVMRENDHPREEIVEWIAQVAEALHYAHQRKVVHRDLKPANIVVTAENGACRPVLLDFGLAMIDETPFRQSGDNFAGTALYTSPEQASATADWATPQSDIFSLGAMLYHILTGELPFRGRSRLEVLDKVRSFSPAAPQSIDDTIGSGLDRVCRRAMEKRPEDRYASAADMARELRAALRPSRRVSPWTWIGRTAGLGAAAAVIALSLGQRGTPVAETPTVASVAPAPVEAEPGVAQDVSVALALQPDGQLGREAILTWDESIEVQADDRFKFIAGTAEAGPLYAFWFKPDGSCVQLDGDDNLRVLECPGRGPAAEWLGFQEAGTHLLLAISTPNQLTESAIKEIVATGAPATGRLKPGQRSALSYYPTRGDRRIETTRGGVASPEPIATAVKYPLLGELGETLRDGSIDARFQALFIRVSPDSDADG